MTEPLPLSEAIPPAAELASAEAIEEALSDILPLLGAETSADGWALLAVAPSGLREALQDAYEDECKRLAVALVTTEDVALWQREMMAAIRSHTLGQSLLGHRGQIPATERKRIGEELQVQMGYLSRFADDNAEKIRNGALED